MTISLYDASVATHRQILGAVEGFMEKARAHFQEKGEDPNGVVETRLYGDMLPFRFQVWSVAHHSLGALKGIEAGVFSPPPELPALDYAGLQKVVADARAGVDAYDKAKVDGFAGKPVVFRFREREIPFTAEGFLLSFSLPNFYFHATTTYDILRQQGAPLGKRDFMGALRLAGAPA